MKMQLAGLSDTGRKRDNNEDAWLAMEAGDDQQLLLVADGVGGRDAGEVASATTADIFRELAESGKLAAATSADMSRMILEMAAHRAHARVSKLAAESEQELSMSCTLTAALVNTAGNRARVDVLQVGDTRAYRFHDGQLEQITEDQTVARQLFRDGRIGEDQLRNHPDRNTLSQSIGLESTEHSFEPVFYSVEINDGDAVLLCSDGLTDGVADEVLAECINDNPEPEQAAQALIDVALTAGGHDNITVVLGVCQHSHQDRGAEDGG
ncbi:PP2C family protein-serine/threonine phosphatase [Wenzhouxiangella sp. EGI_FJ10305]|uniref:PP2C family protein-serine/threonine phosphatase n=1 Tax=Wenzhouxiangella sp. EGI_FJ10305 TaxID=3243768 RepID=UPI0035E27419